VSFASAASAKKEALAPAIVRIGEERTKGASQVEILMEQLSEVNV